MTTNEKVAEALAVLDRITSPLKPSATDREVADALEWEKEQAFNALWASVVVGVLMCWGSPKENAWSFARVNR